MTRDSLPKAGRAAQDGGIEQQLADMYGRWRRPLMHMLRRFHGTPAEAEEAAQEVFARMASAGKAVTRDEEQPYLGQAARHIAIDHWRKSAARGGIELVPLDTALHDPAALAGADATLEQAERNQFVARLDQAVQELPARQREAFMLHRIEGHTVEETAAHMGISTRMAVKHLARGLAYCQVRIMYASLGQMRQLHAQDSDTEAPADEQQP
jgi:RNA polymerase sigma-70 factor (ECF subfamily)